jgi:hypothetical protein
MELEFIGSLLLGAALRFGLPVLATGLLILGLRRLDARWQAEAEPQLTSLQRESFALRTPCWVAKKCPSSSREKCPVYRDPGAPCWQHFRNGRGELREECLDCGVFRGAPVPLAA